MAETTPSNTAFTFAPSTAAIVSPILSSNKLVPSIFLFPKRELIFALSTGQGRLCLFCSKLTDNLVTSGVFSSTLVFLVVAGFAVVVVVAGLVLASLAFASAAAFRASASAFLLA